VTTRLSAAVAGPLTATQTCQGCGLVLPRAEGPTHAYIGASPACWALYERISGAPFARTLGTRSRRLTEDAYAVQHPGMPDRRSVQSVAVHLMGLCVLLERKGEQRRLVPVLGRMPARRTLDLHWLEPPARNGRLTVSDALAGGSGDGHADAVEAWARSVWLAWRMHHETVRGWLDAPRVRSR
jgi:Family of unknown function (DUF5946)